MNIPANSHDGEKQRILNRLRRLEGQVRGLHKMVEEDRPCQEVLTLLAALKSALASTGDVIFEAHLERCQQDGHPAEPAQILKVARLLR